MRQETKATRFSEAARTVAPAGVIESTIETSHGTISVRRNSGPGLPVLWLHDLAEDQTVFASQFATALAECHRLVTLDLPGHGRSSDRFDSTVTCSTLDVADAVIEVTEMLGVDRMVIVGRGYGARIAACVAASCPSVVGVCGIGALPVLRWAAAAQGQTLTPSLQSSMLSFVGSSLSRSDAPPKAAGPSFVPLARSRPFAELEYERSLQSASSVRVALIAGAEDLLVGRMALEPTHYGRLWRGTCQYLPDCADDLLDRARAPMNELLGRFIAEVERNDDADPSWLCLSA